MSPYSILSTNFHFQPSTATQRAQNPVSVSLMSINMSRVYFRQTNVIIQNGISGFFPDIKFQTFPWPGLRKFCFATVTLSLQNNITGNIMSWDSKGDQLQKSRVVSIKHSGNFHHHNYKIRGQLKHKIVWAEKGNSPLPPQLSPCSSLAATTLGEQCSHFSEQSLRVSRLGGSVSYWSTGSSAASFLSLSSLWIDYW